jgi:hypothetical protein
VDYHEACKQAIEKGVVVNTIHCGTSQEGIAGGWQEGAKLAEGEFFNIDQDRTVVQIDCPQDKIIIKLNAELNKTYLWYGSQAEQKNFSANQVAQDENAAAAGAGIASSRAIAKASSAYSNRNRDLIDSYGEDRAIISRVKSEELPKELQSLGPKEREAYVQKMAEKRADIQKQINQLAAEREQFLTKERARLASTDASKTFGDAAVVAIQKQLTKAGFEAETPAHK